MSLKKTSKDQQSDIFKEIDEINMLVDGFLSKIGHEHHKMRDGEWLIGFKRWDDKYVIWHNGYWLDSIHVECDDLPKGLKLFKQKFKRKMEKEINSYDFKEHCGKEFVKNETRKKNRKST